MLTDRLSLMEQAGLVTKAPYQLRPKRFEYSLTPKGEGFLPVLQEMCRWGNCFVPDTWTPPKNFMRLKAPLSAETLSAGKPKAIKTRA